ncbi:AAA family ATPase [Streptacidiphilus albus]|uniref:AAA family ATPase n=1 Tax=Streptacidiphilus albus TaxID=105425 RepID=UPI001E4227BF|nr:ATP-binding protein [Streptacidiphilus albus]
MALIGGESVVAEEQTSAVPLVYLLVGLTGSGKTTYAERLLVPAGVVRLAVDEVVFARHGRYGVDYPEHAYFEKEAPAVAELHRQLAALVAAGRDVVWDHGPWPRKDRDAMKELVEAAGGRWRLLYFPLGRQELLRRLEERNRRGDANALPVTPEALDDFFARFEPPRGEGEEIVAPDSF